MTLKFSKNETRCLLDSLHAAWRNGARTPEDFLNFLDCQSGFYLDRAHHYESKVRDNHSWPALRDSHLRIAKKCRMEARLCRRLHTKIINNRERETNAREQ